MSVEGRDSSERAGRSALCCQRPENRSRATVKVYEPPRSFGLIFATPERPDGCCSFAEGNFLVREDAQAAADAYNAREELDKSAPSRSEDSQ